MRRKGTKSADKPKEAPTQKITWGGIITRIASIGAIITALLYVHDRIEQNKTNILLDGQAVYRNIYFNDFKNGIAVGPKLESPPENLGKWGKFRYYGLEIFVMLDINNQSKHPICIQSINGDIIWGSYKNELISLQRYSSCDSLNRLIAFPLNLGANEGMKIAIRIPWMISEELKNALPELRPDTLYSSHYLMDGYLAKIGRGMFGDEEGFDHGLRELLIKDFADQIKAKPEDTCFIVCSLILAENRQFSAKIPM